MTTTKNQCPARVLSLVAALLLSACATLPVYQPAAADPTVSFVGMGKPSFCSSAGKFQLEVTEANGYSTAKVPANERISIWSSMAFQGYNVTSSCSPAVAFTPRTGSAYIVNAGLSSGQCFIELVREDKSRPAGVTLEQSTGRPGC